MMNFTPSPHLAFSSAFEALIDKAMEAKQQAETPRTYLGASRIGEECERKLAYEYHKTPKDEGRHFKGKTLRIFDRGHDAETRMAAYLRTAGFTLLTERSDGRQFGFYIAKDAEGNSRISGHCDGIITGWTETEADGFSVLRDQWGDIKFPCLWEMKSLGDKGWKDTVKKGCKASKPVYWMQMQLYMFQFELHENPALFTAINGNTGEIYAELVPFDPAIVQVGIDRGARVVSTAVPEEAARIARDSDDFRCKFCDYQDRCWARSKQPEAPPTAWWGVQPPIMQEK